MLQIAVPEFLVMFAAGRAAFYSTILGFGR
jgi:hypothetical protein